MTTPLRIGTRSSALATTQTGHVVEALVAAGGFDVELVHVRTDGDRLTGSLASLGGTGVFVTALREAVLDGRCDLAVHSLKDLPTGVADGLRIGAVPVREDPRDALCARDGLTLGSLLPGSRVGTGSPRRAAQLLAARPDLVVVDIRGNVDTRLRRVARRDGGGDLDAVVLARAGLARLGRLDAVTEALPPAVMTPAAGQGALAIECRAADDVPGLAAALAILDDRVTRLAVTAERALLAYLEAGCAAPVGALGRVRGDELHLDAMVGRTDGSATVRLSAGAILPGTRPADDEEAAAALGRRLAQDLVDAGAWSLEEAAE